jgi:magnesium and cobalt transporter
MLLGVFKVQETRVKDIMIPRSNMVIIKKNSSINEILPLIINSSHSRFPVILENKDEIVGILLAKDLLKYINKESDSFNIEEIIRPSVIIPETKKLNVLLSEFKSGRNHLAVVVDEYGGVSGLITIEDVLEQIVGDIIDEHDNVKQNTNIKKIKNHAYTVAGSTTLDEFNAFFKSNYSSDKFDTISGLLINKI